MNHYLHQQTSSPPTTTTVLENTVAGITLLLFLATAFSTITITIVTTLVRRRSLPSLGNRNLEKIHGVEIENPMLCFWLGER